MFRNLGIILAGVTTMLALLVPLGLTQQTPAPVKTATTTTSAIPAGDWPMYSRDLTSSRYSPLKQITSANVSKLAKAWSYRPTPPAGDEEKAGGKDFR